MHKCRITGSYGNFMFDILRNCQTVFVSLYVSVSKVSGFWELYILSSIRDFLSDCTRPSGCGVCIPSDYWCWTLFSSAYWLLIGYGERCQIPDLQRRFSFGTREQAWSLESFCVAAAAAAKSLQSCPTLCDPIDGSLLGSPVPGILQARTLEWVAISFSSAWKWKMKVKSLSPLRPFTTPWTVAYQAPPSMGFSRQEY